jgi:putative ABC transport system ATP-binding protein
MRPELVNRFFDVVLVQKISAQLLLDGISLVLSIAVGMTVLAFYHPYLLAFDVVLVLAILFMMFVLGQGAVKTSIKESKDESTRWRHGWKIWLDAVRRFAMTGRPSLPWNVQTIDLHYLEARKKHFKVSDAADHFYAAAAGAGQHGAYWRSAAGW